MGPKDADRLANSADPDQTAPLEQFDQGLHCLPRHICPKLVVNEKVSTFRLMLVIRKSTL